MIQADQQVNYTLNLTILNLDQKTTLLQSTKKPE